ncbi:MAG: Gfo/Idh/MocA family oxidoreductase [Anaerolineaceae bacterium]|nr:Gfo/Idh/MocA family oxidoreductase [Anaerolineaceae bacterium]
MRIAIVGCGYVADFYLHTLGRHPELKLVGIMDRNLTRAQQFSAYHGIEKIYPTLDDLINDSEVDIVVNLTNPHSHYEVTKAALGAGKHVYCEKPLAMEFEHAVELVDLAREKNLYLSSAPCNVLGEAAQTAWKVLRNNEIGKVFVAYAEMDDGMIHRTRYRQWISSSGAPWPWKDEFEVGCTMEHAGYYLTWLAAFFGPAKRITSFSQNLVRDKQTDTPLDKLTSDFSVGVMEFENNIVARLTCSIIAPHNRSMHVIGEEGVLTIEDCWDYETNVYKQKTPIGRRIEEWPVVSNLFGVAREKVPLVRTTRANKSDKTMDYFRGVTELAESIQMNRPTRLSADFSLHITELALAMQYPEKLGTQRELVSTFEGVSPMHWAK